MSVKKKRADCKKKAVKKDWIENLVITQTMKLVNNENTIQAIAAILLDMQERGKHQSATANGTAPGNTAQHR